MNKNANKTQLQRAMYVAVVVLLIGAIAALAAINIVSRPSALLPAASVPGAPPAGVPDLIGNLPIATAAAEEANGVMTQRISADVKTLTPEYKVVDWSVSWADSTRTETVTDYITVTPDSDGSTDATVTCHQPFTGIILVTATTRIAGYIGNCEVTYVGKPSLISVSSTELTADVSETIGTYYKLATNNTYSFDITADNIFHQVGAELDLTITTEIVGNVILRDENYTQNYPTGWGSVDTQETVSLASICEPNHFSAIIENGKLKVTIGAKMIENFFRESVNTGGKYYVHKGAFYQYEDDSYCYKVKIRDRNSNKSTELKFRIVSAVTGVTVTPSIEF